MDTRPIGMFDSGCGGLTVLKEYLKELPHEDFIYYGDTAHLPYGDKSKEKIIEYSTNIVDFLLSQNVKMIVIACGTASAQAYEHLKKSYDIPINNIIEPTAKAVADSHVGIIATKGTIQSGAWEKEILNYHPNTSTVSLACPLFVPLVEEGFANTEISKMVIHEYLSKMKDKEISSLVLGCTHYPILEEQIKEEMGEKVKIINAGKESAKSTKEFLLQNQLANDSMHIGSTKFFASDDFQAFRQNAKKLGIEIPS